MHLLIVQPCFQPLSVDSGRSCAIPLSPVQNPLMVRYLLRLNWTSNAAYVLVADDNFDDDDNLMLKSYQSVVPFDESDPTSNMFNIEGDWIDGGTADMSLGQLSVRVNSDTVKFASVLGDSEVKSSGLYQCIKQFLPGISNPSTISWIKFKAVNTVRDWSSAQTIPRLVWTI